MELNCIILVLLALLSNIESKKLSIRREHGVKETGPINFRASTPEWHTFTQKLDHFNPLDSRVWSMVSTFVFFFCLRPRLNF